MAEAPAQAAAGWNLRGRHAVIACAAVGMTACVAVASLAISAPRKSHGAVSTDGITQSWSSCEVLWNLRVSDMIAQGWGSRALYAPAFYQRFHDWAGCTVYTAQAIAEEWESWGMEAPFEAVDAGTWNSMNADSSFQDVDGTFMVRMRGDWSGEALGTWTSNPQTTDLVFTDWAGCFSEYDSTILTMFSAFLQRPKAMLGSYVGIHVRHGDKINEGPISSLGDTMAMVSSSGSRLQEVWLATDDASLMEQTGAYESEGYTFSSASYSRQYGGEPVTCDGLFCHHDNSQEASSAVMTDILQLASATVMIGNWNSNFFRIAWMLNYLRRSESERMEDWCYDVLTRLPCGDRHSFVSQWVESASAGSWGVTVPSGNSVQGCSRPY